MPNVFTVILNKDDDDEDEDDDTPPGEGGGRLTPVCNVSIFILSLISASVL